MSVYVYLCVLINILNSWKFNHIQSNHINYCPLPHQRHQILCHCRWYCFHRHVVLNFCALQTEHVGYVGHVPMCLQAITLSSKSINTYNVHLLTSNIFLFKNATIKQYLSGRTKLTFSIVSAAFSILENNRKYFLFTKQWIYKFLYSC